METKIFQFFQFSRLEYSLNFHRQPSMAAVKTYIPTTTHVQLFLHIVVLFSYFDLQRFTRHLFEL